MNKETILSVLLACGVVFGGVVLLSQSVRPITPIEQEQPASAQQPRRANVERDEFRAAPSQDNQADTNNAGSIEKCTIGGKVIYSDKPCPKDATISQVEIRETSGIVTPARDVVDRTMQRIREERRQENQGAQSSVTAI